MKYRQQVEFQVIPQKVQRRNRSNLMKLRLALILLIIPLTTAFEIFTILRQKMGQGISATQFYLHGRKQSTQ